MHFETRYLPVGDTGLSVEFENEISPEVNQKVRNLYLVIDKERPYGVVETIPSYRSLLVVYDPGAITLEGLIDKLKAMEKRVTKMNLPPPKVTEVPVLYGGDKGPDLDFVAEHNGLSREKVIELHSSVNYLIYMIGFVPGFPYLGGMPEEIAAPRLEKPRLRIPAGSVGIAEKQTGIYPLESPGGWRLIGQTPLRLYDPARSKPILFRVGDYIRFRPVVEDEYKWIAEKVARGEYDTKRWELYG